MYYTVTISSLFHLVLVTQLYPTLCDPMDCSPPGSSVHGILQARILAWVAIQFLRGSSWPRSQTRVSRIAGRFFTVYHNRFISSNWRSNYSFQARGNHSVFLPDSSLPQQLLVARDFQAHIESETACHSCLSSFQFSHSVVSNSLGLHGPQHARLPCPSSTPGACTDSYPSSW